MEEPISFDVYGIIDTENRVKAVSETLESGIYSSEINARKSINEAIRKDKFTIISRKTGWGTAHKFIETCDWADKLTLCQEMYYPGGEKSFCKEHNLHYGGILGCHVCRNFFKK